MKNTRILMMASVAVLALIAYSCMFRSSPNIEAEEAEVIEEKEDIIYVLGQCCTTVEGENIEWTSCYWKNLERTDVPDFPSSRFEKRGIFVSRGDVYLVGWHWSNNDSRKKQPSYWKNEQKFDLDLGVHASGEANCIYVSDGRVYTAGNLSRNKVCYWENTIRTDITDFPANSAGGYVTGIFVDGSDVFVCGYHKLRNGNTYACYWKNGTRTDVTQRNSMATSIFIKNGKVYLAGMYGGDAEIHLSFGGTACYWVDGEVVNVELNEKNKYVRSNRVDAIFVENGTVFMAGSTSVGSCYWRDSTKIRVEGYKPYVAYPRINSLFVKNGVVYTAGHINETVGNGSTDYPCYWVDSVRVDLPMPPSKYDKSPYNVAYSIFVE